MRRRPVHRRREVREAGTQAPAENLKSRREEAWLRERVDGYEDYYRRTPRRLLPFAY